jgi:nucleotide sugar dehydrogenase
MKNNFKKYLIFKNQTIKKVLQIFQDSADSKLPAGIAIVINKKKKVIGSISEGDIRRALLNGYALEDSIENLYEKNPICFNENYSYKEILEQIPHELMKRNRKSHKYLNKIIIINNIGNLVKVISYHELWEQKVATHRHIVVLGLGYVGLTLSLVLSEEGFFVTGVDSDKSKVDKLRNKKSYVYEKGISKILNDQLGKNFIPTTEIPNEGDVYIISVGTPVTNNKNRKSPKPILGYIKEISIQVGKKLTPGNLVILRSTVPIGLSRDFIIPLLEKHSQLKCGNDFHLAFAPERTAEGKAISELRELPQIIGGINEESAHAAAALFRELTSTIVRVSSLEAAEMVKLVNNTYRDMVFSYSNYITQISAQYNIDIFEIIRAANQGYPRDKVPFPSPGVGGPCLTKDPYIFSTAVKESSPPSMSFFEYGRYINENMHKMISDRVKSEILKIGKKINSCKILVCGLAFKGNPETGDVRNSSAVEIYKILEKYTNNIFGHDPIALKEDIKNIGVKPVIFEDGIRDADIILFLNNNTFYEKLNISKVVNKMAQNPIIFDGWHLFRSDDILNNRQGTYINLSQIIKSKSK